MSVQASPLPDTGGTTFNRRPDLQRYLDDVRSHIAVSVPIHGIVVPRFGALSAVAHDTPTFVYTHPAIAAMCDTAFTDGLHVFMYAPFLEALIESERDNQHRNTVERLFLLQHEYMHKLLDHVHRLQWVPQEIASRATDLLINTRLYRMLSEANITVGPLVMSTGLGLQSKEDIDKYSVMSEEAIAHELLEAQRAAPRAAPSSANSAQQARTGHGQTGAPSKHQGGAPGPPAGSSAHEHHVIRLEDLIKTLEGHPELREVIKKLGLPASTSKKAIAELLAKHAASVTAHAQAAIAQTRLAGNYYGSHIDEYVSETLSDLHDPKLAWRGALAQIAFGEGLGSRYSPDYPGTLYFVDPTAMGMRDNVYVGYALPAEPQSIILAIIDTSGSMDTATLVACFSELQGLFAEHEITGEILAFCADTVMRGPPMRLSADNLASSLKAIKVYGRGGTDFTTPIRQVLDHPEVAHRLDKVRALLYFTDTQAPAPKRAELPATLPPMAYIAPPGLLQRGFREAVSGYAQAIEITSHSVVDLDMLPNSSARAQRGPKPG